MASFSNILKKLFGSKAERDLKQITPILNLVLQSYKEIDALTDDQLRDASAELKNIIYKRIQADEERKKELRAQLDDINIAPEKKEALATEVDKLRDKIDEEIEAVLNEIHGKKVQGECRNTC